MPENSENKPEETSDKRMFKKGGAPGPGRGHKNPDAPINSDLYELIKQVSRAGMSRGEYSDRVKAAQLGLKIEALKEKRVVEPITTPFVLKLAGLLTDIAMRCAGVPGEPQNGLSVIDRMVKVCPTCTLICKARDDSEVF